MIGLMNPRKEEKETRIKETKKRKKVFSVITLKNGVTWPRNVGTRKARMKEQTLHAMIHMILKTWWLWLQLQMSMSTPRAGFSTQAARIT